MREIICDAAVIGGGAAGLAAAAAMARAGLRPLVLEREPYLGGILQQCIHAGFGLHRFKRELTGPEYAGLDIAAARSLGVEALLDTTVLDADAAGAEKILHACSRERGLMRIRARAVVLAMGCRERNRGNVGIPGARPAGVMTAGLAQRLINLEGCLPGRVAVIVGSGDIGLIMARRMVWTGARVLGVVELLPYPSGLARNLAQCLDDHDIPLFLSHAVTRIFGRDRVAGVELAPLSDGVPDLARAVRLDCDTVLLSVGLIPENELSKQMGVALAPATGGPVVDDALMTNVPGVFACGNVLHVHDLVDNVSDEAERCGAAVAAWLAKAPPGAGRLNVAAGANLKYVLPARCRPGVIQRFSMRALAPFERATLRLTCGARVLLEKHLRHVRPAEMITVDLRSEQWPAAPAIPPDRPLEFALTPAVGAAE